METTSRIASPAFSNLRELIKPSRGVGDDAELKNGKGD
jgi:hypothetical protein